MTLWIVIFFRVVANPLSNVFQKLLTRRAADPVFIIGATHGLMSIIGGPMFVVAAWRGLSGAFWGNIAVVAGLTVIGNVLIVLAVRESDLSVLGPINAYKAVVSLVPGVVLLGEWPRGGALAGIGLIIAGSYCLVDRNPARPRRNALVRFFGERGVQYRLAALVVSAIEAVYLKRALLASSAEATFAGWAFLGFVASLVAMAAVLRGPGRVRQEVGVMRGSAATFGWLAVTTAVMQFCTIVSFGKLPVGSALALFQTSTLLTVFLGWRVFREGQIVERLAGSAVMVAGAVLIVMSR
jgi:drug/metabolite transporter (DMT)-like permease